MGNGPSLGGIDRRQTDRQGVGPPDCASHLSKEEGDLDAAPGSDVRVSVIPLKHTETGKFLNTRTRTNRISRLAALCETTENRSVIRGSLRVRNMERQSQEKRLKTKVEEKQKTEKSTKTGPRLIIYLSVIQSISTC